MAIPEFRIITIALLKFLKNKKTRVIAESVDFLVDHFDLSEEERTKLKPHSNRETIFHNRVHWAKYYLKNAGLLQSPKKGEIEITKEGLAILKTDIKEMDRTFLMKYSAQ